MRRVRRGAAVRSGRGSGRTRAARLALIALAAWVPGVGLAVPPPELVVAVGSGILGPLTAAAVLGAAWVRASLPDRPWRGVRWLLLGALVAAAIGSLRAPRGPWEATALLDGESPLRTSTAPFVLPGAVVRGEAFPARVIDLRGVWAQALTPVPGALSVPVYCDDHGCDAAADAVIAALGDEAPRPLLVVCEGGWAASRAAEALRRRGRDAAWVPGGAAGLAWFGLAAGPDLGAVARLAAAWRPAVPRAVAAQWPRLVLQDRGEGLSVDRLAAGLPFPDAPTTPWALELAADDVHPHRRALPLWLARGAGAAPAAWVPPDHAPAGPVAHALARARVLAGGAAWRGLPLGVLVLGALAWLQLPATARALARGRGPLSSRSVAAASAADAALSAVGAWGVAAWLPALTWDGLWARPVAAAALAVSWSAFGGTARFQTAAKVLRTPGPPHGARPPRAILALIGGLGLLLPAPAAAWLAAWWAAGWLGWRIALAAWSRTCRAHTGVLQQLALGGVPIGRGPAVLHVSTHVAGHPLAAEVGAAVHGLLPHPAQPAAVRTARVATQIAGTSLQLDLDAAGRVVGARPAARGASPRDVTEASLQREVLAALAAHPGAAILDRRRHLGFLPRVSPREEVVVRARRRSVARSQWRFGWRVAPLAPLALVGDQPVDLLPAGADAVGRLARWAARAVRWRLLRHGELATLRALGEARAAVAHALQRQDRDALVAALEHGVAPWADAAAFAAAVLADGPSGEPAPPPAVPPVTPLPPAPGRVPVTTAGWRDRLARRQAQQVYDVLAALQALPPSDAAPARPSLPALPARLGPEDAAAWCPWRDEADDRVVTLVPGPQQGLLATGRAPVIGAHADHRPGIAQVGPSLPSLHAPLEAHCALRLVGGGEASHLALAAREARMPTVLATTALAESHPGPPDALRGLADEAGLGGKARGLARLRAAGFRVPPSVVVIPSLDAHAAVDAIIAWCATLPAGPWQAPVRLHLRSSAPFEDAPGVSFAGALRTVGDVPLQAGALLEALRLVRDSARTAAAIARHAPSDGTIPVLVQPTLQPVDGGVLRHNAAGHVLIARHPAGPGPVVAGREASAAWHHPDPAGAADALTAALLGLAAELRATLGGAVDAEWVHTACGRLWLVQARRAWRSPPG